MFLLRFNQESVAFSGIQCAYLGQLSKGVFGKWGEGRSTRNGRPYLLPVGRGKGSLVVSQ